MLAADYEDSELSQLRQSVRRFMSDQVAPYHETWEHEGKTPRSLWLAAGKQGYLCPLVAEDNGGAAADFRFSTVINEEIGRSGFSGLIGFSIHSDICAPYIEHYGTLEQQRRYLPKLCSGEMIAAIAMSEPSAGSDLQAITTKALRQGDHYVLNGAKTFISNGQNADLVIVAAKTDPREGAKGVSLFLVESTAKGFERGRNLAKIGMKAQDTSELFFQDVSLPINSLLGKEGEGFKYLMQELPQERLLIASTAIGAAEAALEWTLNYAKERKTFGKALIKHQHIRFKLAQLQADIVAGRALHDRCVKLHTQQQLSVSLGALVKLWCTDLQCKVADECLQIHGGYGYMWEYPIARAWADARVQRIYAGSNEIMKELVARSFDEH
jgi:alkylation response protein AidB-like acyl-CoA dehydrogenase